jgi:predicted PurR-regulated permease PerM
MLKLNKKFLFGKISRKITISFVILGICIAMLGTFIFYKVSVNSISQEVENHLKDTVQSRTNNIETYIDQDTEWVLKYKNEQDVKFINILNPIEKKLKPILIKHLNKD